MKSASSAASGSGQQHVQRSATDVEAEPPTEVSMEIDACKGGALPSVMGPNTRRTFAEKTSPAEAQTGCCGNHHLRRNFDGYREKATRVVAKHMREKIKCTTNCHL